MWLAVVAGRFLTGWGRPWLASSKQSAELMGRSFLPLLFYIVLCGSGDLLAEAELIREPYVQLTTRNSGVVTWRTNEPITPVLRYGVAPDNLTQSVAAGQIVTRVSPELKGWPGVPRLGQTTPEGVYQYEVTVSGLEVDSKYYYGVFDGDRLLAGGTDTYFLRTQPRAEPGRPLRFWVVGDTGDGGMIQRNGYAAMKDYVVEGGRPLDAFVHLGDMAYDDGMDTMFQANFFDVYGGLICNTVTWPTMGNHEGHTSDGVLGIGPYYDAFVLPENGEAGGVPSGSEAYYSFDFGPIHFVCLNSHDEARGEADRMATWLREDLARNDAEWLIAFWHHPPYSKGSHHSDIEDQLVEMREVMMPILEEHGVDVVLAGHSHIYERSMLMNRAYATPTDSSGVILDDGDGNAEGDGAYVKSAHKHPHGGTLAVVSGHGHGSDFSFGLSPVHRVSLKEGGSVIMDLEGDTLKFTMLNDEGIVRDEFQLIKRGVVEPRIPLDDPWSPFGPAIVASQRTGGKVDAHLVAQPNVEDAIVHYTLDGSVPTMASPVYEGPIDIGAPTIIRAISVWRGGKRRSPISSRVLEPAAPGPLRYARIPLLHEEDDAIESGLGITDLHSPVVGITSPETSWFGLRFRDAGVPRGATILSSFVLMRPALLGMDPAEWTVYGDLSAAGQPFTEDLGGLSSRPRTTSGALWNVSAWMGIGFQLTSPDLSEVVEEVVGQPEWVPDSAIGLLVSGAGERSASSFDGAAAGAPEFWVFYDERDALTVASDARLNAFVRITTEGERRLFASLEILNSAAARGFAYTIEGSPSMAPGSWQALNGSFAGPLPGARPGFSHLVFEMSQMDGSAFGEKYFLRVVVARQ